MRMMNKIEIICLFSFVFIFSSGVAYTQTAGVFEGVILNKTNNEPVVDVELKIEPGGNITQTDSEGRFKFENLPLTQLEVKVFKFGFNLALFSIDLIGNSKINKTIYLLSAEEVYLDEIVVKTKKKKVEGTKQVLKNQKLKNPSTSLFNDTMATLQKMPGVMGGEFSGLLYIRGGAPFENIALMDDVVILFPYHWGGKVSIFNPEMVDKVDFYTGGFPAIYGMATSGVIDVKIKEGNFEKVKGFLDLSVTGATLELESPLNLWEQSSFILGARRTHYDLILNLFSDKEGVQYPFFDDLHLKLYSKVNSKHRLNYNTFFSSDGITWEFSEEEAEQSEMLDEGDKFTYDNRDLINSFQWEYFIDEKVKTKSTFAHSYNKGSHEFTNSESPSTHQGISSIFQFRNDWDYSPDQYNSLSLGYIGYRFEGDFELEGYTRETKITGEVETTVHDFKYDGGFTYHGVYLQDEIELIKDDFTVSAGVRCETIEVSPHNPVSPRAGLRKKLLGDMFLNLGWGIYYQYNSTDIRVYDKEEGNPDVRPEKAVHYIVGLEKQLTPDYLLKNNVFYKDYEDLIIDDPAENFINGGIGYAYGFETLLEKKSIGKLDGWLAYTYAVTKRKITTRSEPFDIYNENNIEIREWYYPDFDQRHTISLVANYEISSGWEVYSGWEFHTGTPYTEISGAHRVVNSEGSIVYLPIKEKYNSERLPDYHRFDLKFIHKCKLEHFPAEVYFEFINLFCRKNVAGYYYVDNYSKKETSYYFPFMIIAGLKINF